MRVISQRELRNESGEIMRALDRGEEFTVTRDGVPVGHLSPVERRRFVDRAAVVAAFTGAPAVDPEGMRRDLDAVADQTPHPRAG